MPKYEESFSVYERKDITLWNEEKWWTDDGIIDLINGIIFFLQNVNKMHTTQIKDNI